MFNLIENSQFIYQHCTVLPIFYYLNQYYLREKNYYYSLATKLGVRAEKQQLQL